MTATDLTVWDAVIAVVIVLAAAAVFLAVLAHRGRTVHVSVDIGEPSDPDEPEDESVTDQ